MGRKRRQRHHLSPRERYKYGLQTPWGVDSKENLILLSEEHHKLIHRLFGNRTWEEIHDIVHRIMRMKGRTKCGKCS